MMSQKQRLIDGNLQMGSIKHPAAVPGGVQSITVRQLHTPTVRLRQPGSSSWCPQPSSLGNAHGDGGLCRGSLAGLLGRRCRCRCLSPYKSRALTTATVTPSCATSSQCCSSHTTAAPSSVGCGAGVRPAAPATAEGAVTARDVLSALAMGPAEAAASWCCFACFNS